MNFFKTIAVEKDFAKIIRTNLYIVSLFGYIIFGKQKISLLHNFRAIIITAIFTTMNIFQILSILPFYNDSTIETTSTSIGNSLLCSIAVIQMLCLVFRRNQFSGILQDIHDNIAAIITDFNKFEQKIYDQHTKSILKNNLTLWITSGAAGSFMFLGTLYFYIFYQEIFNVDKILEIRPVPPFILTIFPFRNLTDNFVIAYILPLIGFIIGVLFIPGWYSFLYGLLTYPLFRLQLLNDKLEHFKYKPGIHSNFYIEKHILSCVSDHVHIKRYLKRLETLIAPIIFYEFIVFSILICFFVYYLSINVVGLITPTIITYILAIILVIFLIYNAITNIVLESDKVSLAIYKSEWYLWPVKYQKYLFYIMINAKSFKMKAYIIEMNMVTFIRILRGSYSFFALLKQFSS